MCTLQRGCYLFKCLISLSVAILQYMNMVCFGRSGIPGIEGMFGGEAPQPRYFPKGMGNRDSGRGNVCMYSLSGPGVGTK